MASSRHKHSLHKPWYQRVLRVALPVGGVLALVVASLAVAFNSPDTVDTSATSSVSTSTNLASSSDLASTTSRDDVRPPLPEEAETDVKGTKFAIEDLDLHAGPDENSPVLTEIKSGKKVEITGETNGKWAEVIHKGTSRWVTAKFLKTKLPDKSAADTVDGAISGAVCASGSGPESGLQPDTVRVHRAVCKLFPEITRYGGTRGGGGEHGAGRALDIMTTNKATGDAIAAFNMKHARELGVSQVIWKQRIWTVERAGDGWRPMSSRGSATANHMDHVHVTTFGSSGTS